MRSSLLLAIVAGLVLLGGCAGKRTIAESSAVDAYPGIDNELDFWDELATRRVVTNNDALHGLILLAMDDDPADSYGFRVNAARQWGWMKANKLPPDKNESATVGMIAMAICDILNIEGGLTMSILGASPRYCTRELVFEEILPPRTDRQSMTGLEFIDLVSRVEDIMPLDDAPHRFQMTFSEEAEEADAELAVASDLTR
jgi:hypothetical protein